MRQVNNTATVVAGGAVAVALVVFGIVVTRALAGSAGEPAQITAPGATLEVAEPVTARANRPRVGREELQVAADFAPFDPTRTPPETRYQLPGDRVEPVIEVPEAPARPETPPPAFQVLGTVADANGGIAVIRIGDGTPQLATMGQQIQGYRVAGISAARVQMEGDGRTLNLAVANAAPSAARATNNSRQQSTRGGQAARAAGGNAQGNAQGNAGRATGNATATNATAQAMRARLEAAAAALGGQARVTQGPNGQMIVTGANGRQIQISPAVVAEERVQVRSGGPR